MIATADATVRGVIIGLVVVLLVAVAFYAICRFVFARPDIGGVGAALIALVGCLLVLADNL